MKKITEMSHFAKADSQMLTSQKNSPLHHRLPTINEMQKSMDFLI